MYKPSTTAGKGIKWEWLSVTTCEWNMYNMDVQNIIEDTWSKVKDICTLSFQIIYLILYFLLCDSRASKRMISRTRH